MGACCRIGTNQACADVCRPECGIGAPCRLNSPETVYRAPDLMTNGLTVEARNVYGQEKLYPVNVNAKLVARIAGTKTLSRAVLADVIALGIVVVVQGAHVEPIGCASIAEFNQERI